MEEIRGLANPAPPVGSSPRKQPGRDHEEFKEILERQGGGAKREGSHGSEAQTEASAEETPEDEPIPDEPAKGTLLDERA